MSDTNVGVGDVVSLRSGGPDMTVWKVEGDRVHVLYFEDRGADGYGALIDTNLDGRLLDVVEDYSQLLEQQREEAERV